MNTKEMIAVMQAYEDGKQVEFLDLLENVWRDFKSIHCWNSDSDYRIKATKKPVDLSVLIESGIDCEFKELITNFWFVGKLKNIRDAGASPYKDGHTYWDHCHPRMNHIHAWQGGECPLPEGFVIKLYKWSVHQPSRVVEVTTSEEWLNALSHLHTTVYGFEVIGLADGYCWPWECE